LTYSKVSGPAHGTLTVNANGTYTYTPTTNYVGTDTFTYQATDASGYSSTNTVTVTVADAVAASAGGKSTTANTALSSTLVGLATDQASQTLTYSVASGGNPSHGTLTVNANGTYTYTPTTNYVGTDTFTYQATDASGYSSTNTVTVTVADVVTAAADSVSTNANTHVSKNIASDATSSASQTLTYTVAAAPSQGTITFSGSTFTYTPATNYTGADSFTYQVSDGKGYTATATIALTVTDVPPTAANDAITSTKNNAVSGSLASDGKSSVGLPLAYSKASDPSHGTVTVNSDGSYTYTPATNYTGADSFTYQVSDGHGGTAIATVSVTVVSFEAANPDSYTVITGAPIVVDPRINDTIAGGYKNAAITAIDGVSISSGQTITLGSGTLVTLRSDGRLAVTAAGSGGASESFTYTFTDSNGSKTGTVTLTEYNDAADAQALGFVFTVDTTKPGTSGSNSITLPVNTGTTATNNYTVFWGDGTSNTYTGSATPSHTYTTAGSHTIAIVGEFAGLDFNNSGDAQKITDVSQWGDVALQNLSHAFDGATNLTISAADNPDLTDCTSLSYAFARNSKFNGNLSGWNTSAVTDLSYVFYADSAFNGDISGWNTSAATTMKCMFLNDTAFNQNIGSWDTSNVTDMSDMFAGDTAFNGNISEWNTSAVTNMNNMFNGDAAFNQNIGSWDTSHVTDMSYMFAGTTAFSQNIDGWNTSSVTNMSDMFFESSFNQNIADWNTSAVTSMYGMFSGDAAFNQNIGSWNTSAVTNMSYMFSGDTAFNGNVGGWNTSSVTNISYMFNGDTGFNQNICGWDTSAVTNMAGLFEHATSFNQDIGSWDTSNVTNMNGTFYGDTSFNSDISGWNTSAVTNMNGMFEQDAAFNQDIGGWNTSNVTNMTAMFWGTSFNQNIGSWDTSHVTTMQGMFLNDEAFNQNIGGWNTSAVTNMASMFDTDRAFDGNISGWNTSAVKNLSYMFAGDWSFDQNLASWNISAATNMTGFMTYGAGLSTAHYDATLAGWSGEALHSGLMIDMGASTYETSWAQRAAIVAEGVTIQDGGQFDVVTAAADTASTNANTALAGSLAGDASSAAGLPLTFAKAADPSNGIVSVNADGSYVYTPSLHYVGTDTFSYTVSDGQGYTATNTVTVTVADAAPTATADSAATLANQPLSGSLAGQAASPAGLPLTFSKASDPAHGTVTVAADGSYLYTPAANYTGSDSFTYQVDDGHGGTATATVAVAVADAAPTATADKTASNDASRHPWYRSLPLGETAKTDWTAPSSADVASFFASPAFKFIEAPHFAVEQAVCTTATPEYSFDVAAQDRLLVIQIWGDSGAALPDDAEILLANGDPLPPWIARGPKGCVVSDLPEGIDSVRLRIVQPEDRNSAGRETFLTINTSTGVVLAETRTAAKKPGALSFGEQLRRMVPRARLRRFDRL
ncbi:MAG: BspA family leucine-rich repeat surface protein, partial [Rhodomicrobium sp.]